MMTGSRGKLPSAGKDRLPAAAVTAKPPRHKRPAADTDDEEQPPEEVAFRQPKHARRMSPEHPSSSSESLGDSGNSQSDADSDASSEEGGGSQGDEGLPLGQLAALRQDGSTTPAAMKARAQALRQQGKATTFKRDSKHRPVEMSSKRPVPIYREVLQGGKREVRDPRFESLSGGQYSEERFKKQYAFLYDEKLPAEREELRAALAKAKGAAARAALQARLDKVEQRLRSEAARRRHAEFQQSLKAQEKSAVKQGKRPFYLKKSEQRRQELLAKYEALKASGKLEQYLAKRRKRNAAKDHRYLPAGRRQEGGTGGE